MAAHRGHGAEGSHPDPPRSAKPADHPRHAAHPAFIFGYAVNLDVKHVPLCVYDRDGTQTSQDLLKHFQATDYFKIVRVSDSYRDVVQEH